MTHHLENSTDINTSNAVGIPTYLKFRLFLLSVAIMLFIFQNGLNALHLASKEGHVQVVNEMLRRGANVDAATKVR